MLDGDFEIHLTLLGDPRLEDLAAAHGLKYTHIVLDRGARPDQPMLTLTDRGALDAVVASGRAWGARLTADGFTVVRLKVEASPFNAGVPQTGEEVPAERYFEHHIKLILDPADLDTARRISERHTAHLSRNARRDLAPGGAAPPGRHERFVTQRCHRCGRPEARRRLDALVGALGAAGLTIAEVEQEYVVLDSDPGVDAGWIAG